MRKSSKGLTVGVIPDFHEPFSHPDALPFTLRVAEHFQTDLTISLGDEIDSHAISNYTADPDGFSPGEELDRAVARLHKWYVAYPELLICDSNHTRRPWTKMLGAGLPRRLHPKMRDVLEAPEGWRWKDSWEVDNVIYEHGDSIQGGQYPHVTAAMRNMRSTVIGHHHGVFGLHFHRTPYHMIFGMGCGCLIDEEAYAMAYGRRHKKKPILGCAVVIDGSPILVKMEMKKSGKRWNGKLGIVRTKEERA